MPTLRSHDIKRRFDTAAATFDTADVVHAHSRDGLFARLEPITVAAATVLDLGAATGAATRRLKRRFRKARIISLDQSSAMLRQARRRQGWFARHALVQADAGALPFADDSMDVVFANQLLPWLAEPQMLFAEVHRVLRDGGLFAFATLGPDSLLALRQAWQAADDGEHVHRFADMHDIGDALLGAGLRDAVLDIDRLCVNYATPQGLFRDLTAAGARNALAERRRSLTGRRRFAAMLDALRTEPLTMEFELVYGHCWGHGGAAQASGGVVNIAAEGIPVRRRSG